MREAASRRARRKGEGEDRQSENRVKRQYYLQSARGNRLFELGIGPIALALCGASDPATQARIDAMVAESGQADFAARFLDNAGLDWAADLLANFPAPQAQE
nr:hypothetical protein [Sphingobium sp. CFD-1]